MLPYVTILGRALPTYGLLGMLGIVVGLLVSLLRCKRFGLSRDDCVYIYAFGGVGALLGAKILYLLPLLPQVIRDLPLLFRDTGLFFERYLHGGLVFYGGLLGAILGAWGAARFFKRRLTDFFPVFGPALALAHAFGRLGCFCAGCCYGLHADPPLGIAFTQAIAGPNGIPLLPVQLWECGANLGIALILLGCSERWREDPKARPRLLAVYILCYAPARFVLEFFRGDTVRGIYGPFSTSQWISLAALAAVLAWGLLAQRKRVRTDRMSSLQP